MNLDKKTMLKILFLVFVSILLLVSLPRIGAIISWIGVFLSVLTPFIIGLCMAFIINIPLRLIEKKAFRKLNRKGNKTWLRIRRPICLTLSILFFVLVIVLLLIIIIPALKNAIELFAEKLPAYMAALETKLSAVISDVTGKSGDDVFKINWDTISKAILDFVHKNDSSTVSITVDIISGAVTGVFNVILGFVFSIYILASKEKLGRQFRSLLYSIVKKEKVDRFLSLMAMANSTFNKFVVGQCTEAIIIGVLCCIGMLIFGMPYAPVVSCIIAITALIPVFGAFIGTALGAFIIFLESDIKALWFIIFIIVLQQIETNLIYPRVMGKSVGLPGIWVLFAVMIGGGLFGAVGMLVSVPICSVVYTLGERWIKRRLIQRNIDSDTLNRVRIHRDKSDKDGIPDSPLTEDNSSQNSEDAILETEEANTAEEINNKSNIKKKRKNN